jgi:hypothetical protein
MLCLFKRCVKYALLTPKISSSVWAILVPMVLTAQIEQENDGYYATVLEPPGLDLYGSGNTPELAVKDLATVMLETYHHLRNQNALGDKLKQDFAILEGIFETAPVPIHLSFKTTSNVSVVLTH